MRITNGTTTNTYLKDVQNNLQSMDKLNKQLNTGKKINKLSDNPYDAIKTLNLQNEINSVEKYNSNADEITGWLELTDEALNSISNLTSDIKTLLTSISGTYGKDEVAAVKTEVNEKIKQIAEALNTTYAGKYIFGGSTTDEKPVRVETNDEGEVSIIVNKAGAPELDDKLSVVISSGISIDYNLGINNVIETDETGVSGLDILNKLSQELNKEPINMESIGEISKQLDGFMSNILSDRAIVGAKVNTIEGIKNSNEENILQMKNTLSLTQDTDYADAFIKLKAAEMVYTASLQVGSKLFQNTLLDYMR